MQTYITLASKLPVLALILLASASVIAGDYFAKTWSIEQRPIWGILALLGYFGSGFFYLPTLLREGLVVTSILWSLISIIGFLVIGLILFNESLDMLQTVGVVFGVVSLIILASSMH